MQGCHPAKHAGLALHPEPIAIALNDHRVAVVQEPVEDRRSEDVVAEDLAPLPDELVGGDKERPASTTARPSAMARWVLPTPGGPKRSTLSAWAMKRPVASSRKRRWSIDGCELKSKSSSV